MIGKKNDEIRITTLLGSGSVVGGDFSAQGAARIDGRVDGNVTVKGSLVVGVGAVINGDITAERVLIGGEIYGNINAPAKAELTSTAKVQGNLTTSVLVIDENAVFQGGCDMTQAAEASRRDVKQAVRASEKSAQAALEEALKEAPQIKEKDAE